MKMTRALSAAMLFLLPGAIAAYAQEHEQEKKPEQKQEQAKPAQHQQEAKPAKQPQQAARQQKSKPEAARQQQAKPTASHQEQASRGAATGGHGNIPEAKFHASFGSAHPFHVNRSQFANGSGRFQYGGFWFNAVQPWPVAWLYTDAVYVDYVNGGYFLCDPVHPGVYISINIG